MGSSEFNAKSWANDIHSGDRRALAKAITLIESSLAEDRLKAHKLLTEILPFTGNSYRVGISGPPGVGKSTFIEAFGNLLLSKNHKLAVLAVDPSSPVSGGSILGDKTRMQKLAMNDHAFIRPSPSGGMLGGVSRRTRETMLLCEAAGYQWIFVETVGVGQSEVLVRHMVDVFMTLQIPNSGDELQGIKKGILELADLVIVNKHDGEHKLIAEQSANFLNHALHLVRGREQFAPQVLCVSSLHNTGIEDVLSVLEALIKKLTMTGDRDRRRMSQREQWFKDELLEILRDRLQKYTERDKSWDKTHDELRLSQIVPSVAAHTILEKVLVNLS